jgi:hypothetical protein
MRWIDTLLILLLFLAVCAVHSARGADRPPQAPCTPQAPPCHDAPVDGVRDCGCGGDPLSGFCHCERGRCDCSPITEGARWHRDGWRKDSTGAWFRWVNRAQHPAYLAPVLSSPPAAYFAPVSYQQPSFRGGGRRGSC